MYRVVNIIMLFVIVTLLTTTGVNAESKKYPTVLHFKEENGVVKFAIDNTLNETAVVDIFYRDVSIFSGHLGSKKDYHLNMEELSKGLPKGKYALNFIVNDMVSKEVIKETYYYEVKKHVPKEEIGNKGVLGDSSKYTKLPLGEFSLIDTLEVDDYGNITYTILGDGGDKMKLTYSIYVNGTKYLERDYTTTVHKKLNLGNYLRMYGEGDIPITLRGHMQDGTYDEKTVYFNKQTGLGKIPTLEYTVEDNQLSYTVNGVNEVNRVSMYIEGEKIYTQNVLIHDIYDVDINELLKENKKKSGDYTLQIVRESLNGGKDIQYIDIKYTGGKEQHTGTQYIKVLDAGKNTIRYTIYDTGNNTGMKAKVTIKGVQIATHDVAEHTVYFMDANKYVTKLPNGKQEMEVSLYVNDNEVGSVYTWVEIVGGKDVEKPDKEVNVPVKPEPQNPIDTNTVKSPNSNGNTTTTDATKDGIGSTNTKDKGDLPQMNTDKTLVWYIVGVGLLVVSYTLRRKKQTT